MTVGQLVERVAPQTARLSDNMAVWESVLEVEILRVFCDADGQAGNPLGVADGFELARELQQAVTVTLGYSETIFVSGGAPPEIKIFNPVEQIPMAGHPLVGATWLLHRRGALGPLLRVAAGEIAARMEGDVAWIAAPAAWAPPWEHVQLPSPEEVEALRSAPDGHDFVQVWAWADEPQGAVRARVFAPRVGIPEDEACGSASLLLAHRLRRELTIRHGRGSLVRARPLDAERAEVGGRVVSDGIRQVDLGSLAVSVGRDPEIV